MEYKEFIDVIKKKARSLAGPEGSVNVNHVIKNNGYELDGLVIMEKNRNMSPTIYLNGFYEQYQEGTSIDRIMETISCIYEENKDRILVDVDKLLDYDFMRHRVVYKVINYKSNKKLLEDVPHKRILDLAVVFYLLLEQDETGHSTVLIHNSTVESWKVSTDDLYSEAIINTPNLLKSRIVSMSDIINWPSEEEIVKEAAKDMYVLTNESKINGAACMLYEDVLYEFANKIGRDLYILPSSVHEVILLPKQEDYRKNFLVNMVREVNMEGVATEEILSDKVYEYNLEDRTITM